MSYDQIVTLISSVGFPIVMCAYMMLTTNKTMEEMKDTVNRLCDKIDSLTKERGE